MGGIEISPENRFRAISLAFNNSDALSEVHMNHPTNRARYAPPTIRLMAHKIDRVITRLFDLPVETHEQHFDVLNEVVADLGDLKSQLLKEAQS